MSTWDQAAMQKSFHGIALDAERYANELADRIKRDPRRDSPHVRDTHDEHLAKFFVYDSLAYNRCLESRSALVAELKARLAGPCEVRAMGRFKAEDFERHWRSYLSVLLRDFEAS
jgi:hypothetical protein